ncbi:hypothetical protein CTI12_AA237760 [Artemisia annua]|uniref:Uncharacterized protein n=1 Tax=Artemisia annua TaxID=35608 RepID=A0A2U1NQY4_ARTAN|nr:hypothetical protein CTI12_AA237760 [Artemisia annua]
MSNDNQDPHNYQLPNNHHQPSSPATSNHHLHGFTTPPSSSPESLMGAVLGRAISNSKSTSFQDALTTTTTTNNNQLARLCSDANTSSFTQYLSATTTPPKIPMQNVLRRANTDMITYERQEQPDARTRSHQPIRRALSDAAEYHYQQPPQKTRTPPSRVSSSPIATPESSAGKRSPQLEKMKKIEDMVKEIEQRCLDIINQDEQVEEIPDPPKPKEQEECVGVERLKNGDLRFVLSCACGKRFEMLLKNNGYCFYRLT